MVPLNPVQLNLALINLVPLSLVPPNLFPLNAVTSFAKLRFPSGSYVEPNTGTPSFFLESYIVPNQNWAFGHTVNVARIELEHLGISEANLR